jgi:hypothetical protein
MQYVVVGKEVVVAAPHKMELRGDWAGKGEFVSVK